MGFFNKTEKQKDTETYEMYESCENCGEEEEYHIPRGMLKREFLKDKKCAYCGCSVLTKKELDNK